MIHRAETTTQQRIRPARAEESGRCLAVLTSAFSGDPVARWVWPDPEKFENAFPPFVRAFGGGAFASGTAFVCDDRAGVSLWLPEGAAPDEEALGAILDATIEDERREQVFSLFEQMDAVHPTEPHWYLPLIAVDPTRQNRGVGSALLRHALVQCDERAIPAYLEASSPRNVPLYERHGFEPIGLIQAAGSPPLVPMLRRSR